MSGAARKPMTGSRAENMELACKVIVRNYEWELRDLEQELSEFGKISSITPSQHVPERAKPNVFSFVGEPDEDPPPPRGSCLVSWVDQSSERRTLAYRAKAIVAAQSATLRELGNRETMSLARGACVLKVQPGSELALEGQPISLVFVVVRGIYRLMRTRGGKEECIGSVAGIGQVLGELPLLRGEDSFASIVAETRGRVVAIRAKDILEVFSRIDSVKDEFHAAAAWRERVRETLQLRKCELTEVLHDDEIDCLSDHVMWTRFSNGADIGAAYSRGLFYDCVAAIVIEGEVEAIPSPAREEGGGKDGGGDSAPPPKGPGKVVVQVAGNSRRERKQYETMKRVPSAAVGGGVGLGDTKVGRMTDEEQEEYFTVRDCGPGPTAAGLAASGGAVGPGECLEGAFDRAGGGCALAERLGPGVLRARGDACIAIVRRDDLVQLEATSFPLRTLMDRWAVLPGRPPPGGGGFRGAKARLERCESLPWRRNQEQRLTRLSATRSRGLESFKGPGSGPEDPGMGAYWWARALPVRDVELWHDIPYSEVGVSFASPQEAELCVERLRGAWRKRFARVQPAGSSRESQQLRKFTLERIQECEGNYAAAEMWVARMEERGVEPDSRIQQELVSMYNKAEPPQVGKAYALMEALMKVNGIRAELFSDAISAWCGCGATSRAESMVDHGCEHGVEVMEDAFESLVVGSVREGDIEGAHRCLERMWARDLVPGIGLMNRMVGLYVETGRLGRAIEILAEMRGCGEDEGVPPDATTFICVACGLASTGDAARTKETLQQMADSLMVHPMQTYYRNLLIEAHCISGDMDAARALALGEDAGVRCPVAGCGCRAGTDEESFALLAAGWTRKGADDEAADVFMGISRRGLDPAKVDMQSVVKQWHRGARRQIKGFEIDLTSPPPRLHRFRGVQRMGGSGTSTAFSSQKRMLVEEDPFDEDEDDDEHSAWHSPATTRGNSNATGRFSPLEGSESFGTAGVRTAEGSAWGRSDDGSARDLARERLGRSADGDGSGSSGQLKREVEGQGRRAIKGGDEEWEGQDMSKSMDKKVVSFVS